MLDEFGGKSRPVARGMKAGFLARLVAAQHQQVADAQKLQVEQHVLDALAVVAAAYHVRHHVDAVSLLNGCGYGYGAWAAAYA